MCVCVLSLFLRHDHYYFTYITIWDAWCCCCVVHMYLDVYINIYIVCTHMLDGAEVLVCYGLRGKIKRKLDVRQNGVNSMCASRTYNAFIQQNETCTISAPHTNLFSINWMRFPRNIKTSNPNNFRLNFGSYICVLSSDRTTTLAVIVRPTNFHCSYILYKCLQASLNDTPLVQISCFMVFAKPIMHSDWFCTRKWDLQQPAKQQQWKYRIVKLFGKFRRVTMLQSLPPFLFAHSPFITSKMYKLCCALALTYMSIFYERHRFRNLCLFSFAYKHTHRQQQQNKKHSYLSHWRARLLSRHCNIHFSLVIITKN